MDANPARWAQQLMDSYREQGGVNIADEPGLPSKPEIAGLCLQLMQLLFPGYHDGGAIAKKELAELTHDRVGGLAEDFRRAFLAATGGSDDTAAGIAVAKLFGELPGIRAMLQSSLQSSVKTKYAKAVPVKPPSHHSLALALSHSLAHYSSVPSHRKVATQLAPILRIRCATVQANPRDELLKRRKINKRQQQQRMGERQLKAARDKSMPGDDSKA